MKCEPGEGVKSEESCPSPDLASSVDLSPHAGRGSESARSRIGPLTFFLYAYNPICVLFTRGVI